MTNTPEVTRAKMVAAYALRCGSEADLATFTEYLDQYSQDLILATVHDLLGYLGIDQDVEVEVVHLTNEQRQRLEESGKLEDYLDDRCKDECDD